MKYYLRILSLAFLFLQWSLWSTQQLQDYLNKEDSSYTWQLHETRKDELYSIHVLKLHSQKWRNEDEVDKPLWSHWLTIIQPNNVKFNTALLSIEAGTHESQIPPDAAIAKHIQTALSTHSIVCQLKMIPNQPIKFTDERDPRYLKEGRKEDALIAFSWDKFLQTLDAEWVIRLPMTKAIVKAMDTIQEYGMEGLEKPVAISNFVLTGTSKRGWVCWTTAAVDQRVKAIIPLVIAPFHIIDSFNLHWMAYGEWSPAIKDYLDINLPSRWKGKAFEELMKIEEVNHYQEKLLLPKYLIHAAGDEFFLPDASQNYFHSLPGPKHLRYVPNADHRIEQSDAYQSMLAYYRAILNDDEIPTLTWSKNQDGILSVQTSSDPIKVVLWKAYNPNGRDFRVSTIGKSWESTTLAQQRNGLYQIPLTSPEKGWSAYFIEVHFESKTNTPLIFTTDIFITPDTYPYLQWY